MPSPDPKRIEPRNKALAARLALLVASGRTLKSAAEELGIPYKRAKAWHRNPRFKARIDQLRSEYTEQTLNRLAISSSAAVAELARLMRESPNDTVRLGAARAILDKLPMISLYHDLGERLRALEERAGPTRGGEPWHSR